MIRLELEKLGIDWKAIRSKMIEIKKERAEKDRKS